MQEYLTQIGFIVIVVGVILVILGSSFSKNKTRVEWAFGGFIGPIPFGFASREDWLKIIIVISVIFLFLFILLNLGK